MACAVLRNVDRRDDAEWRERKLHDWLLAVVRFAVTLEAVDRRAVLARACELDALGSVRGHVTFSYFARTSTLVCGALVESAYPDRDATLHRFVDAISKRRLREVFVTALALDPAPTTTWPSGRSACAPRGSRVP
ncbi:MAG TPA: hypothetical protein VGG01_04945 [Xanthobacteraceae bacterium]